MQDARLGTQRIEAFSDGVIAIIVTIMVLDLHLPEHAAAAGFIDGILKPLAPKLISYGMSFLVIAIMWVNHHQLMATAHYATRSLMWWNMLLLFAMSLIPLVTDLIGQDLFVPLAAALYGFVLFLCSAAFTILRQYLLATEPDKAMQALHRRVFWKSLFGCFLYLASVPFAFVSIYISMAIFVLIPLLFFLPDLVPEGEGAQAPETAP